MSSKSTNTNPSAVLRGLRKRTQAKIRTALTGDASRGVRQHIKGKVEELEQQIKVKVDEMEHQPKTIKIFDKLAFTFGVLNIAATEYYVVAEPRKYWLWFTVTIPILLLSRYRHYKKNRMHYFLLDFCYSINLFSLIQLFLLYGNHMLS